MSSLHSSVTYGKWGYQVLREKQPWREPPTWCGPRGKIKGYTAAAKKRFREFCWALMPYLMAPGSPWPVLWTVTLPDDWEQLDYHAAFKRLEKRLRYQFPTSFTVWTLEAQKRGAPHYHGLLSLTESDRAKLEALYLGDRLWPWITREEFVESLLGVQLWDTRHPFDLWLKDNWPACLAVEQAICDAQYVKDPRSQYIAKEVSKTTQRDKESALTGRYWGCWNLKAARSVQVRIERNHTAYEYAELYAENLEYWRSIEAKGKFKFEHMPQHKPPDLNLNELLRLIYPEIVQKMVDSGQPLRSPSNP